MVEPYYLSIYWANFHGFRYESLHQRQAATQQVQADPGRQSLDGYDMLILWLVVSVAILAQVWVGARAGPRAGASPQHANRAITVHSGKTFHGCR